MNGNVMCRWRKWPRMHLSIIVRILNILYPNCGVEIDENEIENKTKTIKLKNSNFTILQTSGSDISSWIQSWLAYYRPLFPSIPYILDGNLLWTLKSLGFMGILGSIWCLNSIRGGNSPSAFEVFRLGKPRPFNNRGIIIIG